MRSYLLLAILCCLGGCQNGHPYLGGQQLNNNNAPGLAAQGTPNAGTGYSFNPQAMLAQASQQSQSFATQMQAAQSKLTQVDAANRELTARIAQAEQLLSSEKEQKKLIQQQLAEAGNRLRETVIARDEIEKRANALYASAKQVGGATITANNSIRSTLQLADIAGLEVRQEGTTIRVEIPADKLFAPGSMQLLPQATPLLDDVAAGISRHYPRQLIVIEGHTDNSPLAAQAPSSSHQLSAAQAYAVVDYYLSRNRLPATQLSSMSFGAHRPRVSNATPQGQAKNRRVELVIYPETLDGKP